MFRNNEIEMEGDMMTYLDEILKRANITTLSDFILYGESNRAAPAKDYQERLDRSYEECIEMIKKYDSRGEDSELYAAVNEMVTEHMEVYMELGIRAGFRMFHTILYSERECEHK